MRVGKAVLTPLALVLLLLTAGCPKSSVAPPVPMAPIAEGLPKPTINFFAAEPASVTGGQTSSLRWSVKDAAHIQIDHGIGEVDASGTRGVDPGQQSITYKLEASNPVGTTVAVVTVNVRARDVAAGGGQNGQDQMAGMTAEMLTARLQDLHFSYDKDEILEEEKTIVEGNARVLKNLFAADQSVVVLIEGHCDERGSSEYNIGLGDKRANFVKAIFVRSGLPESRFTTVSFGREKPMCLELTQDCLARNRRVHFSASR